MPFNPTSHLQTNLITASLRLGVNEGLNHCLKSRARVVQFWLRSFHLELWLGTRSGDYCFQEMNYFMHF